MSRFFEKTVLITGGNSGIGRAAALAFAAEGASVMVAARDSARCQEVVDEVVDSGGVAAFVACDVTKAVDAADAIAATKAAFGGRLDVVFNNAGIIVRDRTTIDTSEKEWDETFAVNVKGTFLVSQAALPTMIAQGGGAIVNNASYFGLVGGRGVAAYAASKGAVVLLTKSMALDHADAGIRVNCVCAGSVDTPMLAEEMEAMGGGDAVRRVFENKHPLGRIAAPDEIAAAVLFLASDDAAFITGAALPIDGGLTAG